MPEPKFNAEYKGGFGSPECWKCEIPVSPGKSGNHTAIMQNFTNAIRHGEELLAPGEEGIHGLTLSNAMHLSAWTDNWVDLPLDEALYLKLLNEKIASSKFVKPVQGGSTLNVSGTH